MNPGDRGNSRIPGTGGNMNPGDQGKHESRGPGETRIPGTGGNTNPGTGGNTNPGDQVLVRFVIHSNGESCLRTSTSLLLGRVWCLFIV